MAFHVTPKDHLPAILRDGLIPHIGDNSQTLGETEARVYAFMSHEAMENALLNWMGEIFEEIEERLGRQIDLVIIEVEDDCFERVLDSNGDPLFECYAYTTIPPSRFLRITDEMGKTLNDSPPLVQPDNAKIT